VEVRRTAGGTPELRVTGRAARRVEEGIRMHLSLSHSATVAGAVVVLES
jgi:phosphopantetheinyl transferase (holo-ACP synthase)